MDVSLAAAIALAVVVALAVAALAGRALGRRAARHRMAALAGAGPWRLQEPRPGRNQAGPSLLGATSDGAPFEAYYGETGVGLFNRWTLVEVEIPGGAAERVWVAPRRQARAVAREGEVTLGDAAFDAAFRVRGASRDKVLPLLPPSVRGDLRAVEDLWHLEVKRGHVTLVVGGWERAPARLEALVAVAARVAALAAASTGRQG